VRILRHDDATIVLRDVPLFSYVFAVVCIAAGIAFGVLAAAVGETLLLTPTLIAIGLGVLLAWASPVITSSFDRSGYEIRERGLLRDRTRRGPTTDVAGVYCDEEMTEVNYRVVIVLRTNAQLALCGWKPVGKRRLRRIAAEVAAFLMTTHTHGAT
jgi:hypothetical protein